MQTEKSGEKPNKEWCNTKELNGKFWLFLPDLISDTLLKKRKAFKKQVCTYYNISTFVK